MFGFNIESFAIGRSAPIEQTVIAPTVTLCDMIEAAGYTFDEALKLIVVLETRRALNRIADSRILTHGYRHLLRSEIAPYIV